MTTSSRARQPRAIKKKQQILEAAIALMFEHGLPGVTHRQVAARAKVPVGSIGYYFNTREELLLHALEGVEERRHGRAIKIIEDLSQKSSIEAQDLASNLTTIFLPDDRAILGSVGLVIDCLRGSKELRDTIKKHRATAYQDLEKGLEAGQRNPNEAPQLVLAIIGALAHAIIIEQTDKPDVIVSQVVDALVS